MNKYTLMFAISHLKKAIWDLECANKLVQNAIDQKLIEDLKSQLIELKIKKEEFLK